MAMAEATQVLNAQKRGTAVAKNLRREGKIPAVLYGAGKEAVHLSFDYQSFRKLFAIAGENTIIEVEVEGRKHPALVYDVQFDPVSDRISHVDLYLVDMTKKVEASVPVKLVGEAPAVKELGGILILQKHEVTIRCLPKDLIHEIEADVSSLIDYHHSLHVSDLKVPPAIEILDDSGDAVANVKPVKVEVEEPVAAAPAEGAASVEGAAAPVEGAPAEGAAPAAKSKK